MRLTDNQGVDIVLDALGGKDWKKGLALLRPFGMLVAYGFANMSRGDTRSYVHMLGELLSVPLISPLSLMNRNRSVGGVHPQNPAFPLQEPRGYLVVTACG